MQSGQKLTVTHKSKVFNCSIELIVRGCLQSINSAGLAGLFDEILLGCEVAYAEGAIGAKATSERSRKGPEDAGLRL
jgi:hypothetical protein